MNIDYSKKMNRELMKDSEKELPKEKQREIFKPVNINYDDPSAKNTYRYASADEEAVNDDFGPTGPNTYQEPEDTDDNEFN